MNTADLLMDLQSRGVEITAEGERLKIRAPEGAITPDLRARLVESKPDVLMALRACRDSDLLALCGRACVGLAVDPVRLASFLVVAEDPAWCTERCARRLAERMAEGNIIWPAAQSVKATVE